MAEKKTADRGEMRRRVKSLLTGGTVGRLRSEGRLMACYVFFFADFTTCHVRVSVRGAAKTMGVSPNTVRRGLQQLVEAAVVALVEDAGRSRATYEVLLPLPSEGNEPCTERTPLVTGGVTSRVQSVHERCARRSRAVCAPVTARDPIQVFPIGSNLTNWGNTDSPEPDRGGACPPGQAGGAGT